MVLASLIEPPFDGTKKDQYHKNRPFRLLAVAALRFVQSYLNVMMPGSKV